MHNIFVYGTLKRGCYNHARNLGDNHTMKSAGTFVGERTISGYKMLTGYYPFMIETGNKRDLVTGEEYVVSDDFKAKLDKLELGYSFMKVADNLYAYVLEEQRHDADAVPLNSDGAQEWTPTYELFMNGDRDNVKRMQKEAA